MRRDEKTLAFADYRGNRQYISVGNPAADDRTALILMDYPGRARLKIYAHVETVPLDADLALARLVAAAGSLPGGFVLRLTRCSAGLPNMRFPRKKRPFLFVEEMTKAVLEAESESAARRTVAAVPSPALPIPTSLHGSLMARQDPLLQFSVLYGFWGANVVASTATL